MVSFAAAAQRGLESSRRNVGLDGVVPNACVVTHAAFSRWGALTPAVGLAHWTRDTTGVVTVSLWRTDDSGAELRFTLGDSSTAGTLSTWTASGRPPHADTGAVIVHREGSADVSVCNTSALIADSVRRAGM
ncbi:MAG TPA: hypothetical protein VF118_05590 [Gemmatimonadaceae bacterium]